MIRIMKASAGSGKTYNLAKTYISLLLKNEDRYAYRHILAVTFTNKATEEMKSRILKELHILATSPATSDYHDAFVPAILPDDAALSARAAAVLRDILHDYSAFAVSTIDKFFQQTLKAFSREIGQFASYQVELDKDSLVAESVDRVLDSLTQDDTGLLSWLTDNVLEQIEQGGEGTVRVTYTYNPDGFPASVTSKISDMGGETRIEERYTYTEYDKYGNWTERRVEAIADVTEGEADGTHQETTRTVSHRLDRRLIYYYPPRSNGEAASTAAEAPS